MSNTAALPSAADLDAVAAEQTNRERLDAVAAEQQPKKAWTAPTVTRASERVMADAALLRSSLIDAMTGPTPQQTDDIIAEYDTAKRVSAEASESEKDAKKTLTALVRGFGHPKAESEHSYIIRGELHTATLTDVTTTSLIEEKILTVKELLLDAGYGDIFFRLFSPRIKHELVGGADEALLVADMPNHLRKKLKQAFAECIKVSNSSPRIKVDLLVKEPKQPRKRAAKKAVQA